MQGVLFLMLHTIPVAFIFASLPALLRWAGWAHERAAVQYATMRRASCAVLQACI